MSDDNFHGHEHSECGEHRTVGSHRAWCYEDQEWCYPDAPCRGCELPALRAVIDARDQEIVRLRGEIETLLRESTTDPEK